MATTTSEPRREGAPPPPAEAAWSADATRAMLFGGLQHLVERGGSGLAALAPGMRRIALPLLAIYATGTTAEPSQDDDENAGEAEQREAILVRRAGTKALLELIELASRTHPVSPGAEPYKAMYNGEAQAPRVEHVMALALAAAALFARAEHAEPKDGGGDDNGNGNGDGNGDGGQASPSTDRVTYVAVAPGEYQAVSGPMTPAEIRRYAMRERSYNQPQLAMLAARDNGFTVLPSPAGPGGAATSGMAGYPRPTAEQYGMMMLGTNDGCGCGGGGGCGCGSAAAASCACGSGAPAHHCGACGGHVVFPPARYDENGNCKSWFSISCETKTRVRECFKQSLCDLVRCVGDEVCDGGKFSSAKPKLGDCLEGFVCSLLTCLPEAICPSPPPSMRCITQRASDCDCNYAVGS